MIDTNQNLNITTSNTIILGTPQAINLYSTYQEKPVNGIVTCVSVTTGEPYVDSSSVACVAELTPGINPCSGCQYPLTDPFKNTTAFEKNNLYSDLLRYNSTSNAISYFSQTFSGVNLQGNEWAVAYTAFNLKECEYTFHIIVHSNEVNLINFCKAQKWDYEIVGSRRL